MRTAILDRSKNASFWHHLNGGRGGLDVPFTLSKIVILDRIKWNSYPPSSQSNDDGAKEQKRAILVSLTCSIYYVQDCGSVRLGENVIFVVSTKKCSGQLK